MGDKINIYNYINKGINTIVKMNKRMKINGFLAILNDIETQNNKSDINIMKNIQDLVDAQFDGYAICVEIMPSSEQCTALINGKITEDDLIYKPYPSIDDMNYYFNIAKNLGLQLREIKFHTYWAKNHKGYLTLTSFANSYKNVVNNVLKELEITPIHATIMNECANMLDDSNKLIIQSLLSDIKALGFKTGFTGTEVPADLINYVDNFYYHCYLAISNKGNKTTFQDSIDGWNRSRSYEKSILNNYINYPEKKVIIDELGAMNYWESLSIPEMYIPQTMGFTKTTNGMPMAIYAYGAIKYFEQYDVDEIYIFWTDTVPDALKNVVKKYKGVI